MLKLCHNQFITYHMISLFTRLDRNDLATINGKTDHTNRGGRICRLGGRFVSGNGGRFVWSVFRRPIVNPIVKCMVGKVANRPFRPSKSVLGDHPPNTPFVNYRRTIHEGVALEDPLRTPRKVAEWSLFSRKRVGILGGILRLPNGPRLVGKGSVF